MDYIEQNKQSNRIIFPDLVRAFALFGIAVVNVAYLANPFGDYNSSNALTRDIDVWANILVTGLFTAKSYTLFSFMFGVGFAYQISKAERQAASFDNRYWRRILGLFAFGLINIMFLFQGDILFIYGFLGAVLYAFKDVSVKALKRWGIAFYALQVIFIGIIALILKAMTTYAAEDMKEGFAEFEALSESARKIFSDGNFFAATDQRMIEWGEMGFYGVFLQGWGILAFFLFGLAAVKSGVLNDANHPVWQKFRRWFLPIGLIGSFYGAWVSKSASGMLSAELYIGMFWIMLFAPFSTAGYLGLIAKWAKGPPSTIKTFLARGGTSSLTAYLLQGLSMSFIFNGYGLGLYGKLGAANCILIAAVVAIFTIVFASLWRKKYDRGPMEYLLRRWTYGGET